MAAPRLRVTVACAGSIDDSETLEASHFPIDRDPTTFGETP
jgi:hypothetical protein